MAKHLTGEAANLSLKGSPYWMAPELMQSVMQKDMKSDLAFAVDIWSLGCTIIEMLNGKPPWSEYEGLCLRDIKGANLLVDSAGVVKLADFGMAKHLAGEAANLSLKGSPYWMAPELMQSVMQKDMKSDLAFAVDIWSLGCTIIEMLNGKPPWSEYEGAAAMFKVMRESPRIPETLSPEGKDFLQCCFRRNPADRPTANALLEHPFLRNSYQDVQSCINGLNGMKIKVFL
uniref:Protein kinase domain-containing protein n=1 Tax=Kalanchoe fedtschenkoi TaxID=63787 RepID=A0A7N0VBE7_KALFE